MRTTGDVIDRVYSIVNVSDITSLLDGGVFRYSKPDNRRLKDIAIVALPINNRGSVLQDGVVFVNVFAPKHEDGTHDENTLNNIGSQVISKLESYSKTNDYFNLQITSESIVNDKDKYMSRLSLRCNYWIQGD